MFHRLDLSSGECTGPSENYVYLYDPLDIIVENYFRSADSNSNSLCGQFEFIIDQLNSSGYHAISLWRLSSFFDKYGHLDILSEQSNTSANPHDYIAPQAASLFTYLAQVLVVDEPLLLQYYLDLELCSLLVGTQIDSDWLKRIKASSYGVFDFFAELRVLSEENQRSLCKINSLSDDLSEANQSSTQLSSKVASLSALLESAHEELDFYYNKIEYMSALLNDYSSALEKAYKIIGKNK